MKGIGVLGTLAGMIILVASRAHYTIDVAVGAFVAVTLWLSYYVYTKNLQLPDFRNNNFILLIEDQLPRDVKEKESEQAAPNYQLVLQQQQHQQQQQQLQQHPTHINMASSAFHFPFPIYNLSSNSLLSFSFFFENCFYFAIF